MRGLLRWKTRAQSAAQEVRTSFGSSFAEVQKLASQALVLPRTTGGSLDLSAEIATLQQSATATEQRAQALRELSIAQTAAAASGRVDAEAMRLEADAAAVGALAAERDAQAQRDRITALREVQGELNKTTSGTRALSEAEQRHVVSAGQARASQIQLGQQFSDFSVQVLSGQSAFVAFAQQAPQAGYALSGFQGKLGAVGAFLTGPWGVALTIGVSALGILGAKLFETEGAAKAAKDATADLASYVGSIGNYFDLATGKITETNAALIQFAVLSSRQDRKDAEKRQRDAQEAGDRALADSTKRRIEGGGTYTPGGGYSGRFVAPNQDLADVFRSGTNIGEKLLAIANGNSTNAAAAAKILEARAQNAKAAKDIAASDAEIQSLLDGKLAPSLRAKSTGGSGSRATELDQQAKLNSATTARERAEAQLALTRTKSKTALDAGTISEAEYTRRVTAGEQAVNRAQAAEKAATAAKHDATKAQTDANKERRAAVTLANEQQSAEQRIANISGRFDAAPRLQDQMDAANRALQEEIDKYGKLTDAVSQSIVAKARAAQIVVSGSPERIFGEYVHQQRESAAVQQLVLQGRDVEANALQQALRFQAQGIGLDDRHLAQLLTIEQRQKAIANAIEDQRRVVGLYVGTVGDLQRTFDDFLTSVEKKPGKAIGGLLTGIVSDFRQLGRNLFSNSIFGGLERKVEEAMRQALGGAAKAPADILRDQASGAGAELKTQVGDASGALAELVAAFRSASSAFARPDVAITASLPAQQYGNSAGDLQTSIDEIERSISDALGNRPANDNGGDIVISSTKLVDDGTKKIDASAVFLGTVVDGLADNLHKIGIDVPKVITDGIKAHLPDVIKGVSYGQLGGSVFSSITGGKQSGVGSALGGIGGEIAGKALAKPIAAAIGGTLGKTLGGAAGPIGSIIGGVAGSAIAGLFKATQKGSATLSFGAGGLGVGSVTGTSSAQKAAATSEANGVIAALNQIADAVGGSITGAGSVSIGTKNGKYVVDTSGQGRTSYGKANDGITAYATQEEAIAAATRDALSDGVIKGISQASQNIIKSGQDLSAAIAKATLIEAVPKSLKAMLDPVGAAIDELNLKFQKTVAALKEGGATTDQMTQAQRLYDLQLAQVKASTDSASATLKGFLNDLKLGSGSPYSLRDQEGTARSQLQPFLDQINAGQSIDQSKYQEAAKSFLDVERQLYGSTQGYFSALDQVQAATNKAITAIDNAVPISTAAADPFGRATADSTAMTATAVQTGNEIAAQTSDLLAQAVGLLKEVASNMSSGSSAGSFIGSNRSFLQAAA